AHPAEVGTELAGLGVAPGVVQHLAVVDAVVGAGRDVQVVVAALAHALQAHAEGPHDLAVADGDDAHVGAFAVQGVEDAVHAPAVRACSMPRSVRRHLELCRPRNSGVKALLSPVRERRWATLPSLSPWRTRTRSMGMVMGGILDASGQTSGRGGAV